ncbi:diguanylate cyclase domain-containing protein [Lichenifustis flavocetrariae]|uniref:Diguanylate cyclase n=1 Tax=Lichenifustis flavocetrariae TaxID=2949735 RepID=A0AA41Z068_9HYPH|nr:diguanylate cyclase [Lichenifustis flavocetrariae]MCW6510462.1 diguanylate cyclase [Lichenifustis flavocetrariae]
MELGAARLARLFRRRAAPAVAALVFVAFASLTGFLFQISRQLDRRAAEQAATFAHNIIEQSSARLEKDVKSYAAWGEAYQHLHVSTDFEWAYVRENIGPLLFRDYGYDDVLVVGPTGAVTYALLKGDLAVLATAPDVDGLDRMVGEARAAAPQNQSKPISGFLKMDGLPFLASAAVISTGGDPTISEIAGPPSVMIFGIALTPARLNAMEQGLLHNLRLANATDADAGQPLFRATTFDGGNTVRLTWTPEQPGRHLLHTIMPPLLLVGAAVGVLTSVVLAHAMRMARMIDAKSQELAEAHAQAKHAAQHDALTNLPNRTLLHDHLDRLCNGSGPGNRFAVLYLDLDEFKSINDSMGHRAGDIVLIETARRLKTAERPGDLTARVGGDEFVLVLSHAFADDSIDEACRHLLKVVPGPIDFDGIAMKVGVSIGVAVAPDHGRDPDALLRCADMAMYEAKRESGSTYRVFHETVSGQATPPLAGHDRLYNSPAPEHVSLNTSTFAA